MQIIDITLYGENKQQRTLSFDLGKVNIITGDSKTGKTQIINIIDYCLGSNFNVAEGIVRDYVFWFAIRFQLREGQLLVAKPNPTKTKFPQTAVYFEKSDKVNIPSYDNLIPNANNDTLLRRLANIVGLDEYTHQAEGLTRPETPATFKHSKLYCFQPQTDIDQKDFLFYGQSKGSWNAQAIKDILPFLLGAIDSESVVLKRRLNEKRRNLNRLKREIKQAQSVVDKTLGKVFELITEAKQVGLVPLNVNVKDREEGLIVLNHLSQQDDIGEQPDLDNDALVLLQSQVQKLSKQRSAIVENIKATEEYQRESTGYESEAEQQVSRLESINLFPDINDIDNSICPLCSQKLDVSIPTIEQITASLTELKTGLQITRKEQSKVQEYLAKLEEQKNEINFQIRELENSIKSIYKEQAEAKRLKDLNIRKGRVLGRISLYLESKIEVNDFSASKRKIKELQRDISNIEDRLSLETQEDKQESILDQLGLQMTNWSKDLELEFKNRTIKFSIKKLTLFIISTDKTIPFNQTGSGENWVAYHLLIHFALHKYFTQKKRPVPNFLILDQLSQAYFPPEKDLKGTGEIEQSEDDKAIKRLFEFIFKRTNELNGKFQTIIVDHAKLKDKEFNDAIKEEWRKGLKLVPEEWIKN